MKGITMQKALGALSCSFSRNCSNCPLTDCPIAIANLLHTWPRISPKWSGPKNSATVGDSLLFAVDVVMRCQSAEYRTCLCARQCGCASCLKPCRQHPVHTVLPLYSIRDATHRNAHLFVFACFQLFAIQICWFFLNQLFQTRKPTRCYKNLDFRVLQNLPKNM